MRKNKILKRKLENDLGLRLREYCEILNPPEYRRKDFHLGLTISEVAASVGKNPNYIFDEIRLKSLTTTISGGKVRISTDNFIEWLAK